MGVVEDCIELASARPREALARLWFHLRTASGWGAGVPDPEAMEALAKSFREALDAGADRLPAVPGPAVLRGLDEHLAGRFAGLEPAPRPVSCDGGFAWVIRRRPAPSTVFDNQAGQFAYWARHHWVVPCDHGGIQVDVRPFPGYVADGFDDTPLAAIAVLPDSVAPAWTESGGGTCEALTDCETRWATVRACLERAVEAGASLLLLPELTVDRTVRLRIQEWLRAHNGETLRFVAAGSFHEQGVNRAHLIDGDGMAFAHHDKLRPINTRLGEDRIFEDIGVGDRFTLWTTGSWIVGFGICLDFCEDGLHPVRDLWVTTGPRLALVPSMGQESTMSAHEDRAKELVKFHGTITLAATQWMQGEMGKAAAWGLPASPKKRVEHGSMLLVPLILEAS